MAGIAIRKLSAARLKPTKKKRSHRGLALQRREMAVDGSGNR